MGKIIYETGRKYGRLYVIGHRGFASDGKAAWLCQCNCGKTTVVSGGSLRRGLTQSCGCLQKEKATVFATKHSMAGTWKGRTTSEYDAYRNARARCNNPKSDRYRYYGGRGVKFLFASFGQFFAELGLRPKGTTVDRKDNNGHYKPGNVRWVTMEEQNKNKRAPNGKKISADVLDVPFLSFSVIPRRTTCS
jgi:hypothetical protein